ncbi:MAG TPA: hypothetical protein VGB76_02185 [Pyrinomonadaceae bacterium]
MKKGLPYCCDAMRSNLDYRCDEHPDPFDGPDNLIYYASFTAPDDTIYLFAFHLFSYF